MKPSPLFCMRRCPSCLVSAYLQANARRAPPPARRLQENCGIFGIFGHPDAAAITALGLHALQHRGQEGSGIVTTEGRKFLAWREKGLVARTFGQSRALASLKGHAAIGHTRYATIGCSGPENLQPFFADIHGDGMALAHNGQIANYADLRQELIDKGCLFQTTSDSELFLQLASRRPGKDNIERLIDSLRFVTGAYGLALLTRDALVGLRDPVGIRPLVYGLLDSFPVLASETCALDAVGARFVRDIAPGEAMIFRRDQPPLSIHFAPTPTRTRHCVFELIYFAKPNSVVAGRNIYSLRKNFGARLASESFIASDFISPIPDSGTAAAIGYAKESGLAYEMALIRGHYSGRSFIEPTQNSRAMMVEKKLSLNRSLLKGACVTLVDDSIVRGTTISRIVAMVRAAGAKEIHVRVASPPVRYPDFYGINTPTRRELIAASMDAEAIRRTVGADSLAFLSLDGLYAAISDSMPLRAAKTDEMTLYAAKTNKMPHALPTEKLYITDHCFTGNYPTILPETLRQPDPPLQLSLLHSPQHSDQQ